MESRTWEMWETIPKQVTMNMFDDPKDHSAWAPIRKTVRWLRAQSADGDLPFEVRRQAAVHAIELSQALPRLGGVYMDEE